MPKKGILLFGFLLLMSLTLIVGCSSGKNESGNKNDSEATKAPAAEKIVYPSKKISFIIPNSPGGGGDTFYRLFAKVAEKYIDYPIIIENMDGGAGSFAMTELMKREADGHTLFGLSRSTAYAIAKGDIPNKLEDIKPIASVAGGQDALFSVKFKTFEEFKQFGLSNPGKLKIASVGTYNDNHVLAMSILDRAGVQGEYIPYESAGVADKAIRTGDAHAGVASVSAIAKFVQDGTLNLLAIGGQKRIEIFPDIPTFSELGLDLAGADYRGFAIKPGTPQEVIDEFHKMVKQVIKDQEWQDYLQKTGQVDSFVTSKEFEDKFIADYNYGKTAFAKFKK